MVDGGGSAQGSLQELTTYDALAYLQAVKEMFSDKKEKYEEFLQIMKDFKAQRCDTTGVIARVKELLKGHQDLILGFNMFLPKGFEITLSPEVEQPLEKKPMEYKDALGFVSKIKLRFQGDERAYKSFLAILNMYKKENKTIGQVYREVALLLRGQRDLLEEFTRFLPNNSVKTPSQHTPSVRNSILHDRNSARPTLRSTPTDQKGQGRGYAVEGSNIEIDKSKAEKMHKRWLDKDRDRGEGSSDHGAENYDPRGDSGPSDDKIAIYSQEYAFCEKVKVRVQNPDEFQEFLKYLHTYSKAIITREELHSMVHQVLQKYMGLMEAFDEFLAREKIGGFLGHVMSKKSLWPKSWGSNIPSKHVKSEDRERVRAYGKEVSGPDFRERDRTDRNGVNVYIEKPIQDLDFSNSESCTPSYRLLPKNYPLPVASQRTELGAEVLNDHWVSVTSGSEDYSFKHMRKNQYEESLSRCEDDRFELDMLLESVNVTIKSVEELLEKINSNIIKAESSIRIEEHLTAIHLRCIDRLYGEHGADVVDVLRNNASFALPVILTRLKQKQEEWARCRVDFNKVWAGIYAKNYHKSLDHRSFYFKQHDTKNLSSKALLAEVTEISGQKCKEDGELMAIAVRDKRPMISHMEFQYSDTEIHEDLYQLMQYSCEEICTEEQLVKVMKIWTAFLEPVLGVPVRAQMKNDLKVKNGNESSPPDHGNQAEDEGHDASSSGLHQVRADQRSIRSNVPPISGAEQLHRTNICKTSGLSTIPLKRGNPADNSGCKMRPNDEYATSLKPTDSSKGVTMSTGGIREPGDEIRYCQGSKGRAIDEKEEGEITSNADLDEYTYAVCMEAASEPAYKLYDTDADNKGKEGAHRLLGESENASVNGDVSASRSRDKECGLPTHEEKADHDDNKAESDGEGNGSLLPFADRFLQTVNPLTKHVPASLSTRIKGSRVFYGNDSFYLLFRLHQTLYERIQTAKIYSSTTDKKWKSSSDTVSSDQYSRFMNALYSLVDGTFDNNKFEDECWAIVGTQSYLLFTLDKLIYKLVKQLQTLASDDVDNALLQLYAYENSRNPERFLDIGYHENVRGILHQENIYRIECSSSPTQLSIQLMEKGQDNPDLMAGAVDPHISAYLHNDFFSVVLDQKEKPVAGIFLRRNKRKHESGDVISGTSEAMEGLQVTNGLECNLACTSSKVSYTKYTEDFLYRRKTRERTLHVSNSCRDQAKSLDGSFKRLVLCQRFPAGS